MASSVKKIPHPLGKPPARSRKRALRVKKNAGVAPAYCAARMGQLKAAFATRGLVAEWLRRGLQILVRGFESLRGLQFLLESEPPFCSLIAGWHGQRRSEKESGFDSLRGLQRFFIHLTSRLFRPAGRSLPAAGQFVFRISRSLLQSRLHSRKNRKRAGPEAGLSRRPLEHRSGAFHGRYAQCPPRDGR